MYRKDFITETDPHPNHVYYDLNCENLRNTNTKDSMHLKFQETRYSNIVHNCEEYEMSIVKFFVSTYSLPVHFFNIVPNQSNRNLGIYTITLVYEFKGDVDTEMQSVLWSPQITDHALPLAPSERESGFQEESLYYCSYDYYWVISRFNLALRTAYEALQARNQADDVNIQLAPCPIIRWDHNLNRPIIIASNSLFDSEHDNSLSKIKIYFNRDTYNLFNGFQYKFISTKSDYNTDYQLILDADQKSVLLDLTGELLRYIEAISDNEPSANWSPVSSLVFTTNSIPIVATQLSTPKIYMDGIQVSLEKQNNDFENIITDITSLDYSMKPTLLYIPQAEYRFIEMQNNSGLINIQISCFWRSKRGRMHPFILPSGGHAYLKLYFRRKLKYIV